ncbi:anti-anti-sigma factor [Rhodobacter veldkampii DSM 11550]|uniref:Anti-sigma factor antagonist n=1 Tax=Phaeovulum veldkampii DSM 11550 TaxID=1185920 RepID=A0A2T4JLM2_9RHOB|nr:STAS domain-containing protein [Phaeovulum veldkampii]MBK5946632.1 anti-anti-sigma factor [Phaeovulum veldkampii DSM 11550]NCU21614.1 anti-sigma factor antagonist [Candidatus Falkowbacteria bacterium]PTE18811.1 anti-sigma factor antagonist [Phaeovulum veldkampii DSM 11550]TDQ59967.1 anti-sigma B factor antagonist [Phaeovulum veldkampii DSM 11550]
MNLHAETRDGALIVQMGERRLDAAIAIRFKDRMREILSDPAPQVILDLSAVDFLDSSGLGAIVAVMKSLPGGCQLELAGLTPNVDKVFRLTRMDSVFVIHPGRAGIGLLDAG